jgi:hypothetical protein
MTIEEQIAQLTTLRNAAGAIVDYVRAGSARHSKSEFHLSKSGEWILEPDNWIMLAIRYKEAGTLEISLGLEEGDFARHEALTLRPGKYRGWTKLLVEYALEVPAAMNYIEQAYLHSKNEYRNAKGRPREVKGVKTRNQMLEEFIQSV